MRTLLLILPVKCQNMRTEGEGSQKLVKFCGRLLWSAPNSPGLPSGTCRMSSNMACTIPRRNSTTHIHDYKEAFLTEREVLKTREALYLMEFTKVNGRDIASFAEIYSYTRAPSKNNKEIPEHLLKLVEKIQQDEAHQSLGIDQIVVNKYADKDSFLPEHSDNEKSLKAMTKIITILIGAERNVMFKGKCSGTECFQWKSVFHDSAISALLDSSD